MNILVFNCGSSSLKYKLIQMPSAVEIAGGEAQRVGPKTAEPARILHRVDGEEQIHYVDMPDHGVAFDHVMRLLKSDTRLVPDAIGHRMVHGGTVFSGPAVVTGRVIEDLRRVKRLAPLHNPPATALIEAVTARFPELPQVVVFDTAYHATIPDRARSYALPRFLRYDLGLRKYGFHGTSHRYVVEEAARFLNRPLDEFNAVSCHLGSGGASLCAVVGGKSVDNTMGYSPLQGLVMSTRCGDLDPAVTLRLLAMNRGDSATVEKLLNKKSGVLGMSGMSADIRDVLTDLAQSEGINPRLDITAQVYLWRLRKYLGAYLAVVDNADAILFTDTIGETVPEVRWAVCTDMETFGVRIDPEKNANVREYPSDVAASDSPVRIVVLLTNEELAIARRTFAALEGSAPTERKEDRAS